MASEGEWAELLRQVILNRLHLGLPILLGPDLRHSLAPSTQVTPMNPRLPAAPPSPTNLRLITNQLPSDLDIRPPLRKIRTLVLLTLLLLTLLPPSSLHTDCLTLVPLDPTDSHTRLTAQRKKKEVTASTPLPPPLPLLLSTLAGKEV